MANEEQSDLQKYYILDSVSNPIEAYEARNDFDNKRKLESLLSGTTETEIWHPAKRLQDITSAQNVGANHDDNFHALSFHLGGGSQDHLSLAPEVAVAVPEELEATDARQLTGSKAIGLQLPVARVKRLVKSEGSVHFLSAEAGVLITKAGELFLEMFADFTREKMQAERRSTVLFKDLSSVVLEHGKLIFLEDIVPVKVKPTPEEIQDSSAAIKEEKGDNEIRAIEQTHQVDIVSN